VRAFWSDVNGRGDQQPYNAEISDFDITNDTYTVWWLKDDRSRKGSVSVIKSEKIRPVVVSR